MRIRQKTEIQNQLIILKLLKFKFYNKNKLLKFNNINKTTPRLKTALNIIFTFHLINKKILFIGTPLNENKQIKQLLKNTKHSFIPETVWIHGVLTNSQATFKHIFKNYVLNNEKVLKFLFNLKNSYDLIVILNESKNLNPLKECFNKFLPTISLNSNLNKNLTTYKISDNLNFMNKKSQNNFFYSILKATIQRSEKSKKKWKYPLGSMFTSLYISYKKIKISSYKKSKKKRYANKRQKNSI